MSNSQSPVVWTVLLLSLVLRLALLAAMLAFIGWIAFRVVSEWDPGAAAALLTGLFVLAIAGYIGGRLARKQTKALEEYQKRLRAKREAAERRSEESQHSVEQR